LRRKIEVVIKVEDDGEDTGATSNLPSVGSHTDGEVRGIVVCRPRDIDAEAFEKLRENGFNFSKRRIIEFTVDFRSWPPHREAMMRLAFDYPSALACTTDDDQFDGYLEFQVYALVSYEFIKNTQRYVTEMMAPYHGVCASWEVLPRASLFE